MEEKNEIRSGYLKRFQREEEICLVSYQLRVQFGNPALRERFPHVLELLLLAALLIFCAEVMFLIRYFSRKIKQELQKIKREGLVDDILQLLNNGFKKWI